MLVDRWQEPRGMEWNRDWSRLVPPYLYLPDGRTVRTCVVLAEPSKETRPLLQHLNFPSELIGGGYPIITDVQSQAHVASMGCLVTDGDQVYALTNRHVTGLSGRQIYTIVRGERRFIGISDKQIGKMEFARVYPNWSSPRAVCNLDVGLVCVNDANAWTAQVFGIGELGPLVDVDPSNINLNMIGLPVRAFGVSSGEMLGRICGLFYRYKSIAGRDYVADLLIGPRENGRLPTGPGDSGTLWVLDEEQFVPTRKGARAPEYRPLAVQWGGQSMADSALNFALATFLSTVCRELDVDLIRNWNIGHPEYWGKTGHYKIGAKACELATGSLKRFLLANLDRIAFTDESIRASALKRIDPDLFVPLADVPDFVWRKMRPKESSSHFADMDETGKGAFSGKTLMTLCKDPINVSTEIWNNYYESIAAKLPNRGSLPFRVWQIYDEMVTFLKKNLVAEFLCAAGILAHYVGDACQPLHVSHLHHGRRPEESRVHSVYEEDMLSRYAVDLIEGINTRLEHFRPKDTIKGGYEAATYVVDLMMVVINRLRPQDILDAFNSNEGRNRISGMWEALGKKTMDCMAEGSRRLATLWSSAWKEGRGNSIPANKLKSIEKSVLKRLYSSPKFLPSYNLRERVAEGLGIPAESAFKAKAADRTLRRRSRIF